MIWKSRHEKYLEAEVERLRNDNRVLLSALLERAVSREAALMLRKPEELNLSLQNIRARAKAVYEGQREAIGKPEQEAEPDLRHWRSTRAEMEEASRKAANAANSNDSMTRLESKLPGGAH
jgi:hypothetical protein